MPGIKENLVSISDLTSRGSTIVLSDSGGVVSNPVNDKKIKLKKDKGTWRLQLDNLVTYDHEDEGHIGAYYTAMPKSKADRYINLHERLGHQSWRVIASMLYEDHPVCIRAVITAKEVKEKCEMLRLTLKSWWKILLFLLRHCNFPGVIWILRREVSRQDVK